MSAIIVTKAKYLGSLLLPSPIESEVTLALFSDRIEMSDLGVIANLDRINKIIACKGAELPAQTLLMAGIVGLVVDKGKQYMVVEWKDNRADSNDNITPVDGILLRFEDDMLANRFLTEVNESMQKHTARGTAA